MPAMVDRAANEEDDTESTFEIIPIAVIRNPCHSFVVELLEGIESPQDWNGVLLSRLSAKWRARFHSTDSYMLMAIDSRPQGCRSKIEDYTPVGCFWCIGYQSVWSRQHRPLLLLLVTAV